MLRFKLDENFSHHLAKRFEEAGYDVETILDEQMSGAPDDNLFQTVIAEQRCLVTLDLDFANIIRYPTDGTAGIVVIRPNRPITLAVLESFTKQLLAEVAHQNPANCLWILEERKLRIRRPEKDF